MDDTIQVGRTFPLEQFANFKVELSTSFTYDYDEHDEDYRKAIRLALIAEIEQAFYEYSRIVANFNMAKMKSPDAVINALEAFRKDMYNRLNVETHITSEEGGEEQKEDTGE